ncbi:hypothetical protein BO94DRAFT_259438 [Aspergillus sclerotioniger CBS 115572]|uniref:Uncharacterized protein n=1 Tax=Aspergillus sclerotioniger CBS 115572 TaxID=1450535 RepID=A0A317VE47_9EURO|nr:hypothetical protein BO94DRAFT_259438 [Aspergillus sclerotioniger CBS 115572]PWY71541.1 hypothetical protein BO94DRAFT_259438 [Aspergillus sclerotioniger CBS 115572]
MTSFINACITAYTFTPSRRLRLPLFSIGSIFAFTVWSRFLHLYPLPFACYLPPYPARLILPHLYSPRLLGCFTFSKHSTRLDDVMFLMFFSFVLYIPHGVLDSVSARPWTMVWWTTGWFNLGA